MEARDAKASGLPITLVGRAPSPAPRRHSEASIADSSGSAKTSEGRKPALPPAGAATVRDLRLATSSGRRRRKRPPTGTESDLRLALRRPSHGEPEARALHRVPRDATGNRGADLESSYNLVNSANPATADVTILQIYCTGLGPVTNRPPGGLPPSTTQLSQTTATPTITIGGVPATVLFSGLAPGSIGGYQVDVLVSSGSAWGASVRAVISLGGITSNTVTITVQRWPGLREQRAAFPCRVLSSRR